MTSVFDLRGPAFLAFYAAFGVVMYLCARWLRHLAEPSPSPSSKADDDPYAVACLRGGEDEVVRVCLVSLIDRGLLVANGKLVQSIAGSVASARRPIERAILLAAVSGSDADAIVKDVAVQKQASVFGVELANQGFWALPRFEWRRLVLYLVCAYLSAWLALQKIAIALERGRSNVQFLIVAMLVLCGVLLFAVFPRRTHAGDRRIRDLKRIFARVHDERASLRRGGESTELVWLAAVFGIAALPESSFPGLYDLFPQLRSQNTSSGDGGGSSSSCGSSSCGGGGGCGGCGGGGD